MKKLILSAIILISTAASASEMCFDSALFTISEAKSRLERCDVPYNEKAFTKLIYYLQKTSRSPSNYSQAVIRSLSELYVEYNSNLPYGPETRYNACVVRELNSLSKIRLKVIDALVYCAP